MDATASLFRWPPQLPQATTLVAITTTTAVATATLLLLARSALWPNWGRAIASPLKTTIPHTSEEELAKLVYRPDAFPGARDVGTPYGSIRVYEFGPEDGEKVIFVHGISTPCLTLTHIAHGLVKRGCRVMLFDLFGRGYSDGVGDLPHDARLYTTQMLLALASSPLAWAGEGAVRVVGYSLGGGIAVHFAVAFPRLVSSLVLLAPAGLIRAENFGAVSRFVFKSGLVPERLLARLTRQRLQQPIAAARKPRDGGGASDVAAKPSVEEVAVAEAVDPTKTGDELMPLEHRILTYVRWMVVHHQGFVPAFMSSIRDAPLTDQHESWKGLAKRKPGTTLVLLAESDEIIDKDDYEQDALPLVGGKENVIWKVLPGNHDFVMTHADLILKEIDDVWGTKTL